MPTALPVQDLDHLLQETLGSDLKVESVTWKPLNEPGENYGSIMYSVIAKVANKDFTEILNLVIKIPPPTSYLLDLFNSPLSFWKEEVFYKTIAPKFIQLQLESDVEHDKLIRLTPQYYGSRLGLKDPNVFDSQAAIVMENLIHTGYSLRDRLLGMDIEHTTLVVRELAKFHALGIGLKTKRPEFFKDTIMPALVHAMNEPAREAIMDMVRQAHNVYKGLPDAQPYIDLIDKTLVYDYEVDYRNFKPTEPWGTIVHNDFWCNNILFKYNAEEKPVGIKIVDFQFGIYNSGAMDLLLLLATSTEDTVLENSLDEMIDTYYRSFIDCLTLLKVNTEKFTRKGFNDEVKKCAPMKFGQCIMMTNVVMAPRGGIKSLEDMNGDMKFSAIGNRDRADKKLLDVLKTFHKRGWLAA